MAFFGDFEIKARYNFSLDQWVGEIYHIDDLTYTTGSYATEKDARDAALAYIYSVYELLFAGVSGWMTTAQHDAHDHSVALNSAVLNDLGDVTITTPSTNHVLLYNGSVWVNSAQSGLDHGSLGGLADDDHTQYLNTTRHDAHDHTTALNSTILDDIGDVVISGVAQNHIIIRNGSSQWVNSAQTGIDHGSIGGLADDDHTQYLNTTRHDAHDHSTALGTAVFDDLSDVTITTPAANHVIVRNGGNTAWVNSAQSAIDHGSLGGLADDDHTQYLNTTRHDAHDHSTALNSAILDDLNDVVISGVAQNHIIIRNGSSQWVNSAQSGIDHGSIGGLGDDDHTQYTRKDTLTTKGDLYVATGASTVVRQAVGSNLQVLVADSGVTNGVKWDNVGVPTGVMLDFGGRTAPTGYLLCDGASVSRTTFATLYAIINPSLGTATMTIASPCVVTLNSHGLNEGDQIYFTTTGALPTGISANTNYYVKSPAANTFNISATRTETAAGTAINTSGSQSGTHTLFYSPYGVPAGSSTNFLVPDFRFRVAVPLDTPLGGSDAGRFNGINAAGWASGEQLHTLTVAELAAHNHTITDPGHTHSTGEALTGSGLIAFTSGGKTLTTSTGSQTTGITINNNGSGTAHNVMQPYIIVTMKIIKT